MDKSDLKTMLRFAHKNDLMHRSVSFVCYHYLKTQYLNWKYENDAEYIKQNKLWMQQR